MPTTDTPGSVTTDTAGQISEPSQRPQWLTPLIVLLVIAAIAAVVVGGVLLFTGDSTSPEEVVSGYIDAVNARDVEAVESSLDSDVVISYDATAVGFEEGAIPDEIGRDSVVQGTEESWAQMDFTVTYEVLSAEGDTVIVDETATFPDATSTRHTVTYVVSDGDLIVSIHHVIEE